MRNAEKNGSQTMKDVQVTVMNERSQAGSATLTKGTIELMHNRRLLFDDDRGAGEPLNETDGKGYGMKVNSRYWLNIFDLQHGESSQRELQNAIDKPLSLFFTGLENGPIEDNKEIFATESSSKSDLRDSYSNKMDWDKFGRTVLFPLGRNKILARLENSADSFDFYAPDL